MARVVLSVVWWKSVQGWTDPHVAIRVAVRDVTTRRSIRPSDAPDTHPESAEAVVVSVHLRRNCHHPAGSLAGRSHPLLWLSPARVARTTQTVAAVPGISSLAEVTAEVLRLYPMAALLSGLLRGFGDASVPTACLTLRGKARHGRSQNGALAPQV